MNTPDVPAPRAPLDRAALERVLARAAELQSATSAEPAGTLSDDQIIELGHEVGLSPDALRLALAEERSRVVLAPARGPAGMWFGANVCSAARVVPGTPESVLTALDGVLRSELPFDVLRRFPDRMAWTVRRSFIDAMRAQFTRSAEAVDLRLAEDVSATVVAVDAERTHVRIDATLADARRRAGRSTLGFGVAYTAGGMVFAIAGATAFVTVPLWTVATALTTMSIRRNYRRTALRVTVAVEQLLDRLQYGPARRRGGGLVDRLLG